MKVDCDSVGVGAPEDAEWVEKYLKNLATNETRIEHRFLEP
jgi:hypothetical protein